LIRFNEAQEMHLARFIAGNNRASIGSDSASPHFILSGKSGNFFSALQSPEPQRFVNRAGDSAAAV
jgi:hypothetical protein